MNSTFKMLETPGTATISHGAPNLQMLSVCWIRKICELHALKGSFTTGKRKRVLRPSINAESPAQNFPPSLFRFPGQHFLSIPKPSHKEGRQKQNTNSILQRYNGFSPTPAPFVPPTYAILFPHTTTWKGFHFTL